MSKDKSLESNSPQNVYHYGGIKPENENGPKLAFFFNGKSDEEKSLSFDSLREIYIKGMEQEAARLYGKDMVYISESDRKLVASYKDVGQALNDLKNSP